MKVPVIEAPSVMPQGGFNAQPFQAQADTTVGTGLAQAGQALGGFVDRGLEHLERARVQANNIQEAQALADVEGQWGRIMNGDRTPEGQAKLAAHGLPPGGFVSVRGMVEAGHASEAAQRAMEKALEEAAGRFQDADAKASFRARATHLYNAYHQRLEEHFASQMDKDKVATANGSVAQHMGMAESGDYTPAQAQQARLTVVQDLQKLGWQPEAIQKFKEEATAAVVKGLLAKHQLADAQDFVERESSQLGRLYADVKTLVDRAAGLTDRDLRRGQMTGQAMGAANQVRDKQYGLVTSDAFDIAAAKALDTIPPDSPLRYELQSAMDRQRVEEARRLKGATDAWGHIIEREFVQAKGQMPAEAEAGLLKYDPERLAFYKRQRAALDKADAIKQGKHGPSKSALAKQEAELRRALEEGYRGALVDDPAADAEDFTRDFLSRWHLEDRAVPLDLSQRLQRLGKEAQAKVGTVEARDLSSFKAELRSNVILALGKKGKKDPAKVEELVAAGVAQYQDMAGGKPLDASAKAALVAQQVGKVDKPGTGWFDSLFGGKELAIEAEARQRKAGAAPAPAAAPKPTRKSTRPPGRYKGKDGRTFIVEPDGTLHEE